MTCEVRGGRLDKTVAADACERAGKATARDGLALRTDGDDGGAQKKEIQRSYLRCKSAEWRARRQLKLETSAWSDAPENVRLCRVEDIPGVPVRRLLFQPQGRRCRRVPIASKHTSQPRRGQRAGPVTMRMGDGVVRLVRPHSWQRDELEDSGARGGG